MYENTSITQQPQNSPAAVADKAKPAQELDEQTRELIDRFPIQLKLSVGAVNDPLEHEADAMADKVMRMPETPFVRRKSNCSNCDYDDEHVHLKPLASRVTPFIQAKSNGETAVSDSVSGRITSATGGGCPMETGTKNFMESRFGADFSDVKIHTGDEPAQLNRSLDAKAFTVSNNIFFNNGQYQPETDAGKHLLAHELTHTLQQSGNAGSNSSAVIRRTPASDAKALAKQIHDAFSAAKVDDTVVLTALGTLARDATKAGLLKTSYKADYTTELEADIKLKVSAANLSRALFLLNAPPANTSVVSSTTVDKVGTEDHKATNVGGGTVSVHTGTDYTSGTSYVGGFSVGYSGSKASESRYFQTLWSEIISTQPDKTETKVNKTGLPLGGGMTMDLTTTGNPKYKIDSGSGTSPFYEANGTNIRTAAGVTDYDRPSEFSDIILKQFDAGATKVVEIDHFDDFLVQEEKAIYQVSLYVKCVYTSKTAVTRSTKFVSGAAITALPPDIKKQLVKEYPKFEYIT